MSFDKLAAMESEIRDAARKVHFKWPSVIEADDLEQEITLRLLTSTASLDKLFDMPEPQRKGSLVRMGHQIASMERTDLEHFSGNYRYSVNEVKKLLVSGALDQEMEQFNAQVFDLREAFEDLKGKNENYYSAIYQRYVLQVEAEKHALSRGLTKLTDLMNRGRSNEDREYSNGGGRFAPRLRNSSALKVTGFDYDGAASND